jgi:hypothetical protein
MMWWGMRRLLLCMMSSMVMFRLGLHMGWFHITSTSTHFFAWQWILNWRFFLNSWHVKKFACVDVK